MTEKRRMWAHILITILIMIFIFQQSALPAPESTRVSGPIAQLLAALTGMDKTLAAVIVRKTAHFTEYLALGMSLAVTVRDMTAGRMMRSRCIRQALVLIPWCIGTVYAVSDEIHQNFVPGRSCELRDVVIDSCGTAAGVALYCLCRRLRGRRSYEK